MHEDALPVVWWLGWFVAAFIAYGIIAIWIWRAWLRDGSDPTGDAGRRQ